MQTLLQWIQRIYNKYSIWSNLFKNSNDLHYKEYTFHIMNMIKNIYDCVKFGKRCDFIFKRISVSKVTGTCIYTLSHIFQKFSRHFELHPLCSAGPRQKHDALIILFFMCPCLFYVDSLFSSISRYSLMLRSMLYYVSRYFEQSNCI